MHLLIVSPFPPTITGIGQYGYHVTRGIADTGAFSRITVLAGARAYAAGSLNHLGNTEIDYCWQPGQLKARQAILSGIKREKPDLVWFNLGASIFGKSPLSNLSGMFTPLQARRMGYPTVVTLHELIAFADLRALNVPGGVLAPLGAHLLTEIATQADVVCLTMRHYVDWLAANHPNVDCVHIPHGAFHEPILLEDPGAHELLLFTTLAPFKGVELLLEAFSSLKMEYPELRLTIAGNEHPRFPGYTQSLRAQFHDLKDVHWVGRVEEDDVIELFRRAQIVFLPYLASTGASSILYRAATWGRAVVASNLSEIHTQAGESDFQVEFFESGSVESLRQTIRGLLDSPDRSRAQTENNFKAIQEMRLERTTHRYIKAFNRALEKRGGTKHITTRDGEEFPP